MANISLDKDGLHLDYPSKQVTSSSTLDYPIGCLASINTSSLTGTWVYWYLYTTGSGQNGWDVHLGCNFGTGRGTNGTSPAVIGMRIA